MSVGLVTALMGEVVLIRKAEKEHALLVCLSLKTVPVVGVNVCVDDGVCCFGVEACSSGRVPLSGRQLLSVALL